MKETAAGWHGIYMLIEGRQYGALKERLEKEEDGERLLKTACRELALEEVTEERAFERATSALVDGYPASVDARAEQILEQTRARMEAAE